jgi:hypothetical protein
MEEAKEHISAGGICWWSFKRERVITCGVYRTFRDSSDNSVQCKKVYEVQCIHRTGNTPRFEIVVSNQNDSSEKITKSIVLKGMTFWTNKPYLYSDDTMTVFASKDPRKKPLEFMCNGRFYDFLINCQKGFSEAFNEL